uniref:Phytochrome n=1 Tax=Kalanchoe fedtschenkoi TaxID=63787 RepID=A0A7N0TVP6_KALFE
MSSKSTTRTNCSRSSSAQSKRDARVVAQTPIDAKLHVDFEGSEGHFDYSTSVDINVSTSADIVSSSTISVYLQKMQRGSLIQPFGCLIAVDEHNFTILAYSENAPEMLELTPHSVPCIEQKESLTIGIDVRRLFLPSGASALQKAASYGDINLMNPILVQSKNSGKPFYAILHRIDVGVVIDLEPVDAASLPVTAAGALKSYKLAAKAISKLQSLPSGNLQLLCDVLVKEVSELAAYDRVMVYMFHEDDHGEVIAESHRPDLEPYLGLHYPATDIPQASRFLFMKNKVRMICDCLASPVKVVQDKRLTLPLCLAGSELRAPHGCHVQYMESMGSIASLVMSVTISEGSDDMDSDHQTKSKLWGLVVCHHTKPRFIPFPLRYACEFLIQVFSVQISKEVELAAQMKEKHILQTQTVLCDMLLRDFPIGIVTQTPNVMDLVRCDGAALYYNNQCWLLGVTPTEKQIRDLINWLLNYHSSSTGLNTDNLIEAGYPGASVLGEAVRGMASIKISSKDFLFWFRSQTSKEIKWGGAKHDPGDRDDGRKMHPRSSFKAFLEVVKNRSLPWEDVEMDAIHSLQLILRGSLQKEENKSTMIISVPSVDDQLRNVDELRIVANEMVRLIETAAVPIFAVDADSTINGWNNKVAELTGLPVQQAIGMSLIELVGSDSVDTVKTMLQSALQGKEEKSVEVKLKTFGSQEKSDPVILIVNACCSRDTNEKVLGVCFVGNNVTEQKMIMDKYTRIQGDFVGIMRSPSPLLPPIFMTDETGKCMEWNDAICELTGLEREDAIGRMLLGEVFTVSDFGCRLKNHDSLTKLRIALNSIIAGQDTAKVLFGFFTQSGKYVEALLSGNKRMNAEGNITGVLCFLHVPSAEFQYALQVQKLSEQAAGRSLNKLAYIRHEIKKPLEGIIFSQSLMNSTELSTNQRQILNRCTLCQEQLAKIVDDDDIKVIWKQVQ